MVEHEDAPLIDAGIAAAPLIADPKSWINRRVETIELLSREETRRRVSVDFTLSGDQLRALRIPDGIVVPISLLAKRRLRAFDLRDEGGSALPVLGREQNGELSLIALSSAVSTALGADVLSEELESLTADLRRIVFEPATSAERVRADFARKAAVEGSSHALVNADPTCRSLLDVLWTNYVLFAVLAEGGANRRILKYAYGDEVDLSWAGRAGRSFAVDEIVYRVRYPDRRWFLIDCPGAWRARSFHTEVIVPEELRFDFAMLCDAASDKPLSALDANSPGAAVSILLGGAALFSGVTAVLGEHRLVSTIFSATRRWLLVVTTGALLASASLAMALPNSHPVGIWRVAAAACTLAALRLTWSSIRARA